MSNTRCSRCGQHFDDYYMYKYRGAYACEDCFEAVAEQRETLRQQIITNERHKTDRFKGIDLSDSTRGRANREILAPDIEIAKIESQMIKDYEGRS